MFLGWRWQERQHEPKGGACLMPSRPQWNKQTTARLSCWCSPSCLNYCIPGSSFGRKKVPDLNPAKFSAGFRKKRRRPEKTSGSKILKNRDDKRLDHTQANCLCAASSFSGAHSNLPVPIALAHLPNGAEITKQKQLVPKQRLPRKNQGVCGKEPLFLCNRVSQVFFYKVGCSS